MPRRPRDRDTNVTVAARTGTGVAGASAGQAVANWWVTGVNPDSRHDLVGQSRRRRRSGTYNVSTAEGRAQLPRVKPGNFLTAINSSVAVIAITPKS